MEEKKELEATEKASWVHRNTEDDNMKKEENTDDGDLKKEYCTSAEDSDPEDGELVDLPTELKRLNHRTFEFQDELELELLKRGFPDLPAVLDTKGRARLRMPSGAHNRVTDKYTRGFNSNWGKDRWGVAIDGSTNIFIQALPGRRLTRRQPDIAFWGYKKCQLEDGILIPKELTTPPKIFPKSREQCERVNPDFVFQFSWGNSEGYEVQAINDMMNRVHTLYVPPQSNNEPPRLGFLLKMRTDSRERTHDGRKKLLKLDVYRIPRGTTFDDAKNSRSGASHFSYAPGQPDVVLEVTAHDLDIQNFWAMLCQTPYQMSAKAIFESLM